MKDLCYGIRNRCQIELAEYGYISLAWQDYHPILLTTADDLAGRKYHVKPHASPTLPCHHWRVEIRDGVKFRPPQEIYLAILGHHEDYRKC